MKEVMAIIRVNKVNATKTALAEAGFPAFTCRPVQGRGKAGISADVVKLIMETGELPVNAEGEALTEAGRLIAKRYFTLIVNDEDVDKVVETFIKVNQTGNHGDGKVFVLPMTEAYQVRNGECATDAY